MNKLNLSEDFDEDELIKYFTRKDTHSQRIQPKNPKKASVSTREFVNVQDDSRNTFKPTYKAARFEEGWLLNSLGEFYEHQWISDVLRRIKGGKEASVYLCQAGNEVDADLISAKVYRPRSLRNLKNDHAYREGRDDLDSEGKIVLDDGMQHAMARRTEYGKSLLHQSWIAYEFTTMKALHDVGADVPRVYAMAGNAILMGYIGDKYSSAPTLSEISFSRSEGSQLFERVLYNIDLLLANDCIHGDLSAYNILYWEGEITLIDFPQVVSPKINRNAFSIFQRDVTRVCEYFQKQGVKADAKRLASDLWIKHGFKSSPEVDIRLLDADDPKDRALWLKQK